MKFDKYSADFHCKITTIALVEKLLRDVVGRPVKKTLKLPPIFATETFII